MFAQTCQQEFHELNFVNMFLQILYCSFLTIPFVNYLNWLHSEFTNKIVH